MASTLTMTRTDRVLLYAKPTLNSSVAPLTLGPTWSADDSGLIVTLVPSSDGSSCVVKATGTVGTVNVTCTGTGQGVISDVVTITVVTNYANMMEVQQGAVTPQ